MKCNFCLEKDAVINLSKKYDIVVLFTENFDQKTWACEECHQKFRDNNGKLQSKKGFYIEIPRK